MEVIKQKQQQIGTRQKKTNNDTWANKSNDSSNVVYCLCRDVTTSNSLSVQ